MNPIPEHPELWRPIKLLILDVDGVLTDGSMLYDHNGITQKRFHAHDGQGIKDIIAFGIDVAVISRGNSPIVTKRLHDLGITQNIYQGCSNKLEAYAKLKDKFTLSDQQVAYVGDDLPDLEIMQQVGLGIAVHNALDTLKQYADWTTQRSGGHGAVREVCDYLMLYQKKIKHPENCNEL